MEIMSKETLREEFKRLDITNAVMFALVMMRNPNLCRWVISASIGREIDEVDVVTTEKTIIAGVGSKNVRLDAVAQAGGEVFDVEMQVARVGDIPRRARYYHSMLDIEFLNGGDDYAELPNSYVIFIGVGPLLGRSFEPAATRMFKMCDLATGRPIGDGAVTVILDASAWETAGGDLGEMLEFVERGDEASALEDEASIAAALQGAVESVKEKEGNMAIMTAAHQLSIMERELQRLEKERVASYDQGKAEGRAEGEAKGEAKLAKLVIAMGKDGRSDELAECISDPKRRDELMCEYGIE